MNDGGGVGGMCTGGGGVHVKLFVSTAFAGGMPKGCGRCLTLQTYLHSFLFNPLSLIGAKCCST